MQHGSGRVAVTNLLAQAIDQAVDAAKFERPLGKQSVGGLLAEFPISCPMLPSSSINIPELRDRETQQLQLGLYAADGADS